MRLLETWRTLSVVMMPLIVLGGSWTTFETAAADASKPTNRLAEHKAVLLPTEHQFLLQAPGDSQEKQGLVWIDDGRLMFEGAIRGEKDSEGLYIWDVVGRTVSKYGNYTRFCYADGYIVAQESPTRPGQPRVWPVRFGKLGEEQEAICNTSNGKGCPGQLNMSCKRRQFVGTAPFGNESMYSIELRSGDGVIVNPVSRIRVTRLPKGVDAQREYFSKPYLLVGPRFPEGKELPFTAVEEVLPWKTSYSVYARRYLFLTERPEDGRVGLSTNWPNGRSQPIYTMDVNGNVEKVAVPSRPEWNKIFLAQIAKPGTVFLGVAGPVSDWGGLFLYANSNVVPLDRGKVEAMSVSPDGCKVAYAIFEDFGKTPTDIPRVKYIDLCAGKGGQRGQH